MSLLDIVTKGSTDRSVTLKVINHEGLPVRTLTAASTGMDLWYRREGAAKTSLTEAPLTALTDAHADGGFLHISDGDYRLDLPDAAFATGANYVDIGGVINQCIVIGGRVRLVNYSLESGQQDEVAQRLASMLEPAAGSPNEFRFTADALARMLTALGLSAGNLDTRFTAITSKTNNLPNDPADASDIASSFAAVSATLAVISTIAQRLNTTIQQASGSPGDFEFTEDALRNAPAATGGGGGGPSAGAIADAVWDELLSGHQGAGSAGAALELVRVVAAALATMLETAPGSPTDYRLSADARRAAIDSMPTPTQVADGLLDRDMAAGADTGSSSKRTVRQALRILRNRWQITGATQSIKKEDDSTESWSQELGTTPGADPVTSTDPA